jgi:hypothetical protein
MAGDIVKYKNQIDKISKHLIKFEMELKGDGNKDEIKKLKEMYDKINLIEDKLIILLKKEGMMPDTENGEYVFGENDVDVNAKEVDVQDYKQQFENKLILWATNARISLNSAGIFKNDPVEGNGSSFAGTFLGFLKLLPNIGGHISMGEDIYNFIKDTFKSNLPNNKVRFSDILETWQKTLTKYIEKKKNKEFKKFSEYVWDKYADNIITKEVMFVELKKAFNGLPDRMFFYKAITKSWMKTSRKGVKFVAEVVDYGNSSTTSIEAEIENIDDKGGTLSMLKKAYGPGTPLYKLGFPVEYIVKPHVIRHEWGTLKAEGAGSNPKYISGSKEMYNAFIKSKFIKKIQIAHIKL